MSGKMQESGIIELIPIIYISAISAGILCFSTSWAFLGAHWGGPACDWDHRYSSFLSVLRTHQLTLEGWNQLISTSFGYQDWNTPFLTTKYVVSEMKYYREKYRFQVGDGVEGAGPLVLWSGDSFIFSSPSLPQSLIHLNLAPRRVGLFPKLGKTLEKRGIKKVFNWPLELTVFRGVSPLALGWEEEGVLCLGFPGSASNNSPADAEERACSSLCAHTAESWMPLFSFNV